MKKANMSGLFIVMAVVGMLFINSSSFASGDGHGNNNGPQSSSNIVVNANPDVSNINKVNTHVDVINKSSQDQMQGQLQGQMQGQGQKQGIMDSGNSHASGGSSDQTQSQSVQDSGNSTANASGGSSNQTQQANNTGNAQSVNFSTPRAHHNTPSAALFVPMPTAVCQQTIGAAGMMPGVGFSVSGSYTNENCEQLELAKALASIGQLGASLEIMCASKHGNKAALCRDVNNSNKPQDVEVQPVASNVAVNVHQTNTIVASQSITTESVSGVGEWKRVNGSWEFVR